MVGHCEEHSMEHFNKNGAPLVLNIKKVPKLKDGEPYKITKLAINKPGGMSPERE
jgi:hypothetical protein